MKDSHPHSCLHTKTCPSIKTVSTTSWNSFITSYEPTAVHVVMSTWPDQKVSSFPCFYPLVPFLSKTPRSGINCRIPVYNVECPRISLEYPQIVAKVKTSIAFTLRSNVT